MSGIKVLDLLVYGVDVSIAGVSLSTQRAHVLDIVGGATGSYDEATRTAEIDLSGVVAGCLCGPAIAGSVNPFGATPNLHLQSDGTTPGGVWSADLSLGTAPASAGRVCLTDGDALVWDDGSSHNISCLSQSGGYVTLGAQDDNVIGVLLRAGTVLGAGAYVQVRTNGVNRLTLGDTGVDFPSATAITYTGNPTVDGGLGQWWVDKFEVGSALTIDAAGYLGFGTAPGSGATARASAGNVRVPKTWQLKARATDDASDADIFDLNGTGYLTIGDYSSATRVYYTTIRAHSYARLCCSGVNLTCVTGVGVASDANRYFASSLASPCLYHETDSTADVVAGDLTIYAKGVSAAGGTHAHAGNLGLRGGIATGLAANTDGNVWIHVSPGALADWKSAEKVLWLADCVTAPSAGKSGGGFLYSSGGALYWRGANGATTCIAGA